MGAVFAWKGFYLVTGWHVCLVTVRFWIQHKIWINLMVSRFNLNLWTVDECISTPHPLAILDPCRFCQGTQRGRRPERPPWRVTCCGVFRRCRRRCSKKITMWKVSTFRFPRGKRGGFNACFVHIFFCRAYRNVNWFEGPYASWWEEWMQDATEHRSWVEHMVMTAQQ